MSDTDKVVEDFKVRMRALMQEGMPPYDGTIASGIARHQHTQRVLRSAAYVALAKEFGLYVRQTGYKRPTKRGKGGENATA